MRPFKASALKREHVQQLCLDSARDTISCPDAHTEVIRVDGGIAIKFGRVSIHEAYNQHEAFALLDSSIVKVPRVFDYFDVGDCGFLVMEYVDGRHPQGRDYVTIVSSVARCLKHMHTVQKSRPGPLFPGTSHGILWSDEQTPAFDSTDSLAAYLNSRLINTPERFDLTNTQMVLCHLDAAPRNILLANDNIWLLDWESAGFYPRAFEYCAIRLNCGDNGQDSAYAIMLEDAIFALEEPSPFELQQAQSMQKVVGNNMQFSL